MICATPQRASVRPAIWLAPPRRWIRRWGLVSGDPAILQERAEVSVLQADWPAAERFAKQAIALGSKTGPLCRRHWATIEQSRLARGEKENAASARAQIAGCTVPGMKRY